MTDDTRRRSIPRHPCFGKMNLSTAVEIMGLIDVVIWVLVSLILTYFLGEAVHQLQVETQYNDTLKTSVTTTPIPDSSTIVAPTPSNPIDNTTIGLPPANLLGSTTVAPTPATSAVSTTVAPTPATSAGSTTVTPTPATSAGSTTIASTPANSAGSTTVNPILANPAGSTTVTPNGSSNGNSNVGPSGDPATTPVSQSREASKKKRETKALAAPDATSSSGVSNTGDNTVPASDSMDKPKEGGNKALPATSSEKNTNKYMKEENDSEKNPDASAHASNTNATTNTTEAFVSNIPDKPPSIGKKTSTEAGKQVIFSSVWLVFAFTHIIVGKLIARVSGQVRNRKVRVWMIIFLVQTVADLAMFTASLIELMETTLVAVFLTLYLGHRLYYLWVLASFYWSLP